MHAFRTPATPSRLHINRGAQRAKTDLSDLVNDFGGKAFVTKRDHQTGTDRVFEVFESRLNKKPDIDFY